MTYFYKTDDMEKNLAGEAYSPTEGAWVTGERIIFGKMRIPAGGKAELHSHPNEQFAIVLSGTCRMTIGGETGTITPGDIAHIPPDTVHSAEILGDEGLRLRDGEGYLLGYSGDQGVGGEGETYWDSF